MGNFAGFYLSSADIFKSLSGVPLEANSLDLDQAQQFI